MSVTSQYAAAQDGGFLASRKTSPIGIGGAIAVHAGVVAVLLLIPGKQLTRDIYTTVMTYAVPPDAPPPERKPPPDHQKIVQKPVDAPESVFPLNREPNYTVREPIPSFPPIDPGPGPVIDTPPVHKPVFVEPRMDPRYARNLQPDYPPARLREDEEGKVIVRVHIGADGRVLSIDQVSATHPDFWRATREQALKAWRFLPATRDGVAIESDRVMTVYFNMQSQ